MSRADTVRFRHSPTIWVAAIIAFLGTLPIAGLSWYFTPLLLIPLAVWAWALRAGTNADANGVRIRALLGERRIDWSEIVELAPNDRGKVVALLRNGQIVTLPAVGRGDLPILIAASGQAVVDQ